MQSNLKMITGRILLGVTVSLFTAYILGRRKMDDLQEIADKLSFQVNKIKSVQFNKNNVKLVIDLALINNSNKGFSVNSSNLINLKKILVYTNKGYQLAEAEKHINNIALEANSHVIIENIEIYVNTSKLGHVIGALVNLKKNDLITKAHLEIFGKPYIV